MLDYAAISDIGDRDTNEDCVGMEEKNGNYCFVVCDGLGGHGMGDIASRFVTDIFLDSFLACNAYDDFFFFAFSSAQNNLLMHQEENNARNKMRTTVASVVVNTEFVSIGYIGDSRVYIFDNSGIKQRTLDHSVPQILALTGEIKDQDIRFHPDRNKLLRAMGTEWSKPMFELLPRLRFSECRAFLLCSDGFWEYITEEEMITFLNQSTTAEEWLSAMTALVKSKDCSGKKDNFSAIAIINPSYV